MALICFSTVVKAQENKELFENVQSLCDKDHFLKYTFLRNGSFILQKWSIDEGKFVIESSLRGSNGHYKISGNKIMATYLGKSDEIVLFSNVKITNGELISGEIETELKKVNGKKWSSTCK